MILLTRSGLLLSPTGAILGTLDDLAAGHFRRATIAVNDLRERAWAVPCAYPLRRRWAGVAS